MEKLEFWSVLLTLFFLSYHLLPPALASSLLLPEAALMGGDEPSREQLQNYIVHVRKPEHLVFATHEERREWHESFLPTLTLDSGEPRMIYSYQHAISGFAARLTPAEVEAMRGVDGFLRAQPDETLVPYTTRTQQLLGLTQPGGLWESTNMAEGIVVGVVDSGVTPDHPSFKDRGMPPRPLAWVGGCDFGPGVCNNKLITARAFNYTSTVSPSPEDTRGHGTHVASIAVGNFVDTADNFGAACGIAAGSAPRAHLAFYKTSFSAIDTIKAIEQAINDGVDVINLSLGGQKPAPFHGDYVAVAALAAVKKGISVVISAGNSGPAKGSIVNVAPWTLTVGASTTDRALRAILRLGDGQLIEAESKMQYYKFMNSTPLPLIYPGDGMPIEVKNCSDVALGGVDVRGKVVMCMGFQGGNITNFARGCNVIDAGGAAMVLMNQRAQGSTIIYDEYYCLSTVQVGYQDAGRLKTYVRSVPDPTVVITIVGTTLHAHPYPRVAYFSSRGPSWVTNGVLKPDILGPGVNILAGSIWKSYPFRFDSGTSMAAPHLTGIAAQLKKSHPDWTPAAIYSAIMTSSDALDSQGNPISDETGNPADHFATGAGHVNPNRADTPGLVYDRTFGDYIPYICGLGYTPDEVDTIVQDTVDCSTVVSITGEELNYPSFFVYLGTSPRSVQRTVTNVGRARSSYTVSVDLLAGILVDVFPRRLDFSTAKQKRNFTVTFSATNPNRIPGSVVEGQLRWTFGGYVVRSPISVTFI